MADVLVLDIVEKRSGLFLDVIQDACFVILRRRHDGTPEHTAGCMILRPDGKADHAGRVEIASDGSPWVLPATDRPEPAAAAATLQELGYRLLVGYVVPHRHGSILRKRHAPGTYPLLWPKAVAPNGALDFTRPLPDGKPLWVRVPEGTRYVVRVPSVIVQRTSNRKQPRRITAAAVTQEFIDRYGGYVGENHVLIAVPQTNRPAISIQELTALLNSDAVNQAFGSVCGTISVSARLLASLKLPVAAVRSQEQPTPPVALDAPPSKGPFSELAQADSDDENGDRGEQGKVDFSHSAVPTIQASVRQELGAAVVNNAADAAEPGPVWLADLADAGLDALLETEPEVVGDVVVNRPGFAGGSAS